MSKAAEADHYAFTPSVKAVQLRKGSRAGFQRLEKRAWNDTITDDLAAFIAAQTSFFIATATADGQPYIQHRGGPAGFLHVLDNKTVAFADFSGNRQYLTAGNLAENPKAHLFLIDYVNRQRVKIWGTAKIVEDDPALLSSLMPPDYEARPEQAVVFVVTAWDANCPRHIPQKLDLADVARLITARDNRIVELEAEIAKLKGDGP